MRCLSCGEEMAVTAIAPDRALAGFEHRTFTCAPCGATEGRLVLSRDQPAPPQRQAEASTAGNSPGAEIKAAAEPEAAGQPPPPLPEEPVHEEPAPMLNPAAAWTRAVEKLRHRQADLNLRAEQAKKANWNYRFDRVWQRLVPDYPEFSRPNQSNQKIRRRTWSPQASARSVIPRRRPVVELPLVERSPEEIQKFNEFWDSLAQRQLPAPASEGSPLAPLPRSLSLVPIESAQAASAATRAILMLSRPHPDRIAA